VLKKSDDTSDLAKEKQAWFDTLQKSEIQPQQTPPGQ